MASIPQVHHTALKPHISVDESVEAVTSDPHQSLIVTDRRFVAYTQGMRDEREAEQVEAIAFDHVAGVRVETLNPEEYDVWQLGLGAVGTILGFLLAGGVAFSLRDLGSGFEALSTLVFGLIGLAFLGSGLYALWDGLHLDDGHISIHLAATSPGADRSYRLPRSQHEFAEALTTTLGSEHRQNAWEIDRVTQ